MDKPKIALILLRAEWFDSVVAIPELVDGVEADQQEIVNRLSEQVEISVAKVVNSPEILPQISSELSGLDLDLVVLVFQVWAEDFYLLPLLEAIGNRPIAVWAYVPWARPPRLASFVDVLHGSGPVGTFEGMGTLKNLGVHYSFTFGAATDPRPMQDLLRMGRAAQVVRSLKKARFGLLPCRNDQMQSTFIDEFRLRSELGPTIQYLSVAELKQTSEAVSQTEVDDFLYNLRTQFEIRKVTSSTLEWAGRASLGLAHLAVENHLDLLSLNDTHPEVHALMGLRPCLYPPLFEEKNILLSMEGDLGAATSMFILSRLINGPFFFVEFWYWDEEENILIGGHAGAHNPGLGVTGKIWIDKDFEYYQTSKMEGAHFYFVARPGQVTLLQLRGTPGGWQAIATRGEAIDSDPWLIGYPHAAIRLQPPIEIFLQGVASVGSTQHWIMAYGDVLIDVQQVCKLLHIPLLII